jgi:enamine deaminase RidA (YjgF/YER057c/UK114 family)
MVLPGFSGDAMEVLDPATYAVAGQCGYRSDRSLVEGLTAQTRLALENLRAALKASVAGSMT